jgi:energy-coupling factor transporter ATP-binding protein EcfA2
MKVLVFDTETTGLPPNNREINVNTIHTWPHIVQFSYVMYDDVTNRVLKIFDTIVRLPENVVMSVENMNIHGICQRI